MVQMMVKMINVTIPDDIHELLEKIKKRENLPNNAEALVWVIRKAAGVEE
jgi:tartrate dehydratase alpha subunit/fumarate hydratase class I-like protein